MNTLAKHQRNYHPATWTVFDEMFGNPRETHRAHYITGLKTACGKTVPRYALLHYVEPDDRCVCKKCRAL